MYIEKEAEAPARMAVVVNPTVWRTRAELGVRAAIVYIEGDLVVRGCRVVVSSRREGSREAGGIGVPGAIMTRSRINIYQLPLPKYGT